MGAADPLRDQLLEAASRVFARKGYDGTKIKDIIKASGLSSGAMYGRFTSKDELLLAAVLDCVERDALTHRFSDKSVVEMLVDASRGDEPLDDQEAMHLEAFIAARREPSLAAAITDARKQWRETIADPLVERALEGGEADPSADIESIIYLMQTLHLGLLVQRGAGQRPPDSQAWQAFVEQLLRAVAQPRAQSSVEA